MVPIGLAARRMILSSFGRFVASLTLLARAQERGFRGMVAGALHAALKQNLRPLAGRHANSGESPVDAQAINKSKPRKSFQQMPRLQEIRGVQSLAEGVENRGEKVAGLFGIALIEPKLGQVAGSAKFE
jgi:hypothetical protein